MGVVVLLVATGTGQATAPQHGPEDTASARAVAALTGADPAQARLPASFAAVAGYQPAAVGTRLINPNGSCSSPIDLREAFEDACRAHDLGYDLLRHAAAQGGPLGPWARKALDAQLTRDLSASCDTSGPQRPRCRLLASLATVGVTLNSWRQGWSVPVTEHGPFVRGTP